jgi:hypothetical protein
MPKRLSSDHKERRSFALSQGKLFFIAPEPCNHKHQRQWRYAYDDVCEMCAWERRYPKLEKPKPKGAEVPDRSPEHIAAREKARAAGQETFYGDACTMHRRHDWNRKHTVKFDRCVCCTDWFRGHSGHIHDGCKHLLHARNTDAEIMAVWELIPSFIAAPILSASAPPQQPELIIPIAAPILSASEPPKQPELIIPPAPEIIPPARLQLKIDEIALRRGTQRALFNVMPLLLDKLPEPLFAALMDRALAPNTDPEALLLEAMGDGVRLMINRARLSSKS